LEASHGKIVASFMSAKRFLDTNVLFYACDSSDQHKQLIALRIIDELSASASGVISAQVLGEFFHATVIRRKLLSVEEAEKIVRQYAATFPVVAIDFSIVSAALNIHRQFQNSYWDSLIIAAAAHHGCSEVLTEDLNHGQVYNGVTIVNPFRN
jgi:predicted nucleic acid-binding protein